MVSPKIIVLYAHTWKHVLKIGGPSGQDLIKFAKNLPTLREALRCSVCSSLLKGDDVHAPSVTDDGDVCDHFACKDCVGKVRTATSISCYLCSDWKVYAENDTLQMLMQGYRQFCRYFLKSKECTSILEIKHEVDPEFDAFSVLELITEGSRQYNPGSGSPPEPKGLMPINVVEIKNRRQEGRESDVVQLEVDENKIEDVDIKYEPAGTEFGGDDSDPDSMEETELEIEIQAQNDSTESIEVDDVKVHPEKCNIPPALLPISVPMEERVIKPLVKDPLSTDNLEQQQQQQQQQQPQQPRFQFLTSPIKFSTATSSGQFTSPMTSQTATITIQRPGHPGGPTQIQLTPRQIQSLFLGRPSLTIPGQPTFLSGTRVPGTNAIRLARLSFDGKPVTMYRHILTPSTATGLRQNIINTADLGVNQMIVRPATVGSSSMAAASAHVDKWPDANKVLQYASGGGTTAVPSGSRTMTMTSSSSSSIINQILTTPAKIPAPINLSASSSPMTIGMTTSPTFTIKTDSGTQQPAYKINIGQNQVRVESPKITVVSSNSPKLNQSLLCRPPAEPVQSTSAGTGGSGKTIYGTVVRADNSSEGGGPVKKLKIRLPNPKQKSSSSKLRRGCRCGNAATQPGKLTCCGQRCPCYVDAKSCTDCRCRGCRNPHLPGGKKLLQGINAVIDTNTNTTVPLPMNQNQISSVAGSSSSIVVSSATTPTTTVSFVPVSTVGTSSSPQIISRIIHPGTSHSTTTGFSQLFPLGSFPSFIPISLISPANHNLSSAGITTLQTHSAPIHIQSIQSVNNTMPTNNIKNEHFVE